MPGRLPVVERKAVEREAVERTAVERLVADIRLRFPRRRLSVAGFRATPWPPRLTPVERRPVDDIWLLRRFPRRRLSVEGFRAIPWWPVPDCRLIPDLPLGDRRVDCVRLPSEFRRTSVVFGPPSLELEARRDLSGREDAPDS